MILLGAILLLLGWLLGVHLLYILGAILLVIGIVLLAVGHAGPIRGRWY